MIIVVSGNLLEAKADALVNTVNCVGVMGKGIALQFKQAFPENFKDYARACDIGEVRAGKMFVHRTERMFHPKYIINFPTKRHWKAKSKLEDIELGLKDLVRVITELNIRSIAVPPLGSGLGGLNWEEVKRRIIDAFDEIPDVEVLLYEPKGAFQSEGLFDDSASEHDIIQVKNGGLPRCDRELRFMEQDLGLVIFKGREDGIDLFMLETDLCLDLTGFFQPVNGNEAKIGGNKAF